MCKFLFKHVQPFFANGRIDFHLHNQFDFESFCPEYISDLHFLVASVSILLLLAKKDFCKS